ncbi:hypothetical protein O6H91_Y515900 [Diphasiastrum complanatum]|nr:hypothetical protein O6H91_Y515900 [Diphasiastrum complanatum]
MKSEDSFMPGLTYSPIQSPSASLDHHYNYHLAEELSHEVFHFLQEIPGSWSVDSALSSEQTSPIRQQRVYNENQNLFLGSFSFMQDESIEAKFKPEEDVIPTGELLEEVVNTLTEFHPESMRASKRSPKRSIMSRKQSKREKASVEGLGFVPGRDDHIIRERQRRDDMSNKFAILESLLPWRPKRDRAAIVDDAIHFVQQMQRLFDQLEKKAIQGRLSNDQQAKLPAAKSTVKEAYTTYIPCRLVANPIGVVAKPSAMLISQHRTLLGANYTSARQFHPEVQEQSRDPTSEVSVHAAPFGDSLMIEITCSTRVGFMTSILKMLEDLQLDVSHCNYLKRAPQILCIIGAKV